MATNDEIKTHAELQSNEKATAQRNKTVRIRPSSGTDEVDSFGGIQETCEYCKGNGEIVKPAEQLFADCIRENLEEVVQSLTEVYVGEKKKMVIDYKKVRNLTMDEDNKP